MAVVFLGLGSNRGKRQEYIDYALRALAALELRIIASAPVYQTKAYGYPRQPDFLNTVIKIETFYSPPELLKHCKDIERLVGRTHSFRWGPREIDIDILFYENLVFYSDELTIPHPDLHNRRFVLAPLADIDPDWMHPILKNTAAQLLANIEMPGQK